MEMCAARVCIDIINKFMFGLVNHSQQNGKNMCIWNFSCYKCDKPTILFKTDMYKIILLNNYSEKDY